jgi:hypothetical protein
MIAVSRLTSMRVARAWPPSTVRSLGEIKKYAPSLGRAPSVPYVTTRWTVPLSIRWALGVLGAVAAAALIGWLLFVPAADWLGTHDIGQHAAAHDNDSGFPPAVDGVVLVASCRS